MVLLCFEAILWIGRGRLGDPCPAKDDPGTAPPGGNIWEGNTGKKAPVEKHRVSRKVARTRPGCSSAVIRCTLMHLPRVPSPPRGVASPKYLCLLLTGSSVNYACVRSRSPRPMSPLQDAAEERVPIHDGQDRRPGR